MATIDEMIAALGAAGWSVHCIDCEHYGGDGEWAAHAFRKLASGNQEFRAGYGDAMHGALLGLCRDCGVEVE